MVLVFEYTNSFKKIMIKRTKRSMGNKLVWYRSATRLDLENSVTNTKRDKTKRISNTILPVSKVTFKLITTEALFWITL